MNITRKTVKIHAINFAFETDIYALCNNTNYANIAVIFVAARAFVFNLHRSNGNAAALRVSRFLFFKVYS